MKLKMYIICYLLVLVFSTIIFVREEAASQMPEAKKNADPSFWDQLKTHSLEDHTIQIVSVKNNAGQKREFSYNDGFQEIVLRKIVYWMNKAEQIDGKSEIQIDNPSNKMTLNMVDGKAITIEPAYSCAEEDNRIICTAKEGELIVSENGQKVQLKSQPLSDWLLVGWRKEVDGLTKEALLEETLYTRYLNELGPSYAEYFMCPKISIKPIDGDPRRHIMEGSALNYFGHHDGNYNQLTFSVSDSNITGLQVSNVKINKQISPEEVDKQCQIFE